MTSKANKRSIKPFSEYLGKVIRILKQHEKSPEVSGHKVKPFIIVVCFSSALFSCSDAAMENGVISLHIEKDFQPKRCHLQIQRVRDKANIMRKYTVLLKTHEARKEDSSSNSTGWGLF